MTNKTAKKNKKVFRQGVVQIHGRFVLTEEGDPVLITANGASRGVHSVVRDGDALRVFLNMPKATFLGTPIVSYLDDDDAAGSIYQFVVSDVVSTPVPNPTGELAYFDISVFNYDNELSSFPGTCLFTVNVTTAVVPNGMLPNTLDESIYDPNEVVARTAIGPTAIVHTPKVESVSVYGRFRTQPDDWNNSDTYVIGNYTHSGFKVYKAIASSTNVEPGVDNGWEASWIEVPLLLSEEATSEGVLSVVLNNDGQYADLPANVYVVTLDPVSPIVQFLGAPTITPIVPNGVEETSWNPSKIFCEGVSATYGTSANQIVFAFYDIQAVPEINLLTNTEADVVHFTLQYTTSNVF